MKKRKWICVTVLLLSLLLAISCGESKNESDSLEQDQDVSDQSSVPDTDQEPPSDREDGSKTEPGDEIPPSADGSDDDPNPPVGGDESDPTEELPRDMENIELITSQGQGYGEILRLKSGGEIVFSPEILQLRELLEIGEVLEEYTAELVFVLLDDEGNEYYAYPALTFPIVESNGDWFEIYLQSADFDGGFCPMAGQKYNVELTVIKDEIAVMYGVWRELSAIHQLESSPYYRPTALPSEEDLAAVEYTVWYLVSGGKGGTVEGSVIQHLKGSQKAEQVTAVAAKGYEFIGWSDGYTEATREGDAFVCNRVIYAIFSRMTYDVGVADMYIQTDTGEPILSKVNYVGATVQIVGAAEDKYNVTLTGEMRGRGNSSFSASAGQNEYKSKNSYRLKLTEKTNLLGVGKAENRDWVLQANKYDASNLRNYFVWNLANQMGTFPFVPNCTWVNLYINGDYRGIYMITDHVEAADDRVEVDDSLDAPDKGYLVELDFRGADELDVVEGLDYFYLPGFYDPTSGISNPREWVIKSDVTSTGQTDFIKAYLISCHEAIMGGDRVAIEALVDIPSLVDMFILEELSKDVDAGGSSMFMQKDTGGKLYFTAPWDFDFGFGTYGPAVYTDGFVCESRLYDENIWFASLVTRDWFLQEVYDRLLELADMIELAKVGVRATADVISSAADRNDERWGIYGQNFHSYVSGQVSVHLESYEEHIDFLCDWIDERYAWMLEEIAFRLGF